MTTSALLATAADMAARLEDAIAGDGLRLAYQPVVSLRDGSVHGFEALCRWTDPVLGPVGPDVFVPLAERHGLIGPLGDWVLERACATLAGLNAGRGDRPPLRMAVNVSAFQLADPDFAGRVRGTLAAHGLVPELVCLEITESALVEDNVQHCAVQRLLETGARLAIDDFGTGYSSLHYLAAIPAHTVKIDRSFVASLGEKDRRVTLLNGVVGLARSLSLATVAEGVETLEQAELLAAMECDLAQGYYFSRPLEEADLAGRLAELEGGDGVAFVPASGGATGGDTPGVPFRPRAATVLIVDDDPVSLHLSRYLLGAHDRYRVLTAANAAEFARLMEQERPDLVLLDVNLPGRSGSELADELRADPRTADLPVLAITAFPEKLRERGLGGFSGLLAKPWDPEQFVGHVDAALDSGLAGPAEVPLDPGSYPADFAAAAESVIAHLQDRLGFALWMVTRVDGDDWLVLHARDAGYGVAPGDVFPWSDSICSRMTKGLGPRFAPRTADIPAYSRAPITARFPIGAYIGVPLYRDGAFFGTLCAIDPSPQRAYIKQDQPLVELMAQLLSQLLSSSPAAGAAAGASTETPAAPGGRHGLDEAA